MMWPFKRKPFINPVELRYFAAAGHKDRLKERLKLIKDVLQCHAIKKGVTRCQIKIPTSLEADILRELAICGINVELSTRCLSPAWADYEAFVTYFVTF